MNIPYYVRKRIIDIVISTFMLFFLFFTLLPIGWMVYSSLKDSTDIAIGKVGLRTAGTDILEIQPVNNDLLVLTADGGINLLRAADLNPTRHKSYKTVSSSYVVDDKYIWLASANRGLIRISRDNFGRSKSFKYPLYGFDYHKVPATYIKKEGDNIFVSLEYKGFNGVLKFDARNMTFLELMKGEKKRYFPNAGTVQVEEFPGVDAEIFSKVRSNGYLYLGGSSGKLFKHDLAEGKIVAQTKLPRGHLLVRWHNYIDMWRNVNFGLYLKNSLIICGFTMFFAMIFSSVVI